MPTATYIALANTTLTSATGTVTFSNIPSSYRDLVVIANSNGLTGAVTFKPSFLQLNNLNGGSVAMYGNGSSTGSLADSGLIFLLFEANQPSTDIIHIMDYSATDKHKTVLIRGEAWAVAGRVATTNAITSVKLTSGDDGTDQFNIGSSFALYGIVS